MDPLTQIVWYVGAVAFGILFAKLMVVVLRKLLPSGTTRRYWQQMGESIHGLFFGDDERFWAHYGNVIRQSVKYVGHQLFGIVLAFMPLIFGFLFFGPWIFEQWDRYADLAVFPSDAGVIIVSNGSPKNGEIDSKTLMLNNGQQVALSSKAGSQVVCQSGHLGCLVLQGFGFHAISLEQTESNTNKLVIVRTAHGDWNPLWPYLSDPEFLFFLSLSLSSILFFGRANQAQESFADGYRVELVDYVLTRIATSNVRIMTKLGDWETSLNSSRIAMTEVDRPIFIAGLARSGTTILLEKIATMEGVATHRYRDFPFIMTPLIWNRLLSFIGGKQTPVERPHQDKIHITRDSPDAFEEPIWQHFFPYLHSASELHVLESDVNAPEFVRFYREHIKKILLARRGTRYLSKGNYNLPRIKYIDRIFPDARFLVPIRHPLAHIYSLVRQHELFVEYAKDDPKVAEYLRAVGHYEFGPQRAPICLKCDAGQEIANAWSDGRDMLGYALQWADVYRYVRSFFEERIDLNSRIHIVRFENLCANPEEEFKKILRFIEMGSESSALDLAQGIEKPAHFNNFSSEEYDEYWGVVEDIAGWYGYSRDPRKMPTVSAESISYQQ